MSGQEIFVIIIVALLLFGADKLPEIARGLAKGMRDFRKATDDIKREFEESTSEIRKDLTDVSNSISSDVTDISRNIQNDVNEVSDSLKQDINEVRDGINQDVGEIKDNIDNIESGANEVKSEPAGEGGTTKSEPTSNINEQDNPYAQYNYTD